MNIFVYPTDLFFKSFDEREETLIFFWLSSDGILSLTVLFKRKVGNGHSFLFFSKPPTSTYKMHIKI